MNDSPIVILASERSGTNLLRSLLDNHSMISAPPPPHLFRTFLKFRVHYGDLTEERNSRRLLEDVVAFVNHPYHTWNLETEPEAIRERYRPNSFAGIINAVWKAKATSEGKRLFASKDIDMFDFALELKAFDPGVRFLYLARDPRDVVASWMKKPVAHFTPYNAALNWLHNQRACFDLFEARGIEPTRISYESLTSSTGPEMARVLECFGLPVEEATFQTSREKAEAVSGNPYWENLSKPVIANNSRKYVGKLSDEEIEIVETLCEPYMRRLGYEPESACRWRPGRDFFFENQARAEKKKEETREWMKVAMPDLLDKWNYQQELRQRLVRDFPATSGLNELEPPKGGRKGGRKRAAGDKRKAVPERSDRKEKRLPWFLQRIRRILGRP